MAAASAPARPCNYPDETKPTKDHDAMGDRSVTGSEAGISGNEQIRIALRTIAENGGVAQMQQIYQSVEVVLNEKGIHLSKQGKASLRFFINKVAVQAGYVYPSDKRKTGWRITPKGREYIESITSSPATSAQMITTAGGNFQLSLVDVYKLLEADQRILKGAEAEEAKLGFEVFRRAGVILAVTAWETFIEDTLTLHFEKRLAKATAPRDVESTFNAVAQAWIDRMGRKPRPPDMSNWTGDGWKEILLEEFREDVSRFNTPNSKNVKKLFKKYLDLAVVECWKWRGMSPDVACQQLDELIDLRGELVHMRKNVFRTAARHRSRATSEYDCSHRTIGLEYRGNLGNRLARMNVDGGCPRYGRQGSYPPYRRSTLRAVREVV